MVAEHCRGEPPAPPGRVESIAATMAEEMRTGGLLLALMGCARLLAAQPAETEPVKEIAGQVRGVIRGGALSRGGDAVYTWGSDVYRWELEGAKAAEHGARERLRIGLASGEGGCVADVNGDGKDDLVLEERPASGSGLGKLIWLEGPTWKTHEVDSGVEMSDCMETTLLGKPGILMVQRHVQVRFYPYPFAEGGHTGYQEVYSFYTASREAGLVRADVDGDGREDILCGNYWIRSPDAYSLPWHLFAIELYNQAEESANLRLALLRTNGLELVVAQKAMANAKVAVFRVEAGGDPKALWSEKLLTAPGGFHFAAGLAVSGRRIFVGEHNGAVSRLLEYVMSGDGSSIRLEKISSSPPVVLLLAARVGVVVVKERGVGVVTGAKE